MKKKLCAMALTLIPVLTKAQQAAQTKYSDGIYIKISANDCMTATSGLTQIMQQHPAAQIVMEDEYIEDSTDLKDKFNLNGYTGNIIWNNNLHHFLAAYKLSEAVQVCKGRIVKRAVLKGLDKFNPADCK